ncbi:hypothetical protein ACFLYE_03425 [Chloroflexota bacterium]
MGGIKSAREIALEKVAGLEAASDEERLRWKYVPEGERLAARFMKEDLNLVAELEQYREQERKYMVQGAVDILISNINLPRNDLAKKTNKKAMDGLKTLKSDKVSAENVYSKIRRIFSHHAEQGEQQRKQTYQSLKAEFEARFQQARTQQSGSFVGAKIDVERQPQFQEEWRRVQAQMDAQYTALLDEYKQELRDIP